MRLILPEQSSLPFKTLQGRARADVSLLSFPLNRRRKGAKAQRREDAKKSNTKELWPLLVRAHDKAEAVVNITKPVPASFASLRVCVAGLVEKKVGETSGSQVSLNRSIRGAGLGIDDDPLILDRDHLIPVEFASAPFSEADLLEKAAHSVNAFGNHRLARRGAHVQQVTELATIACRDRPFE